MSIRIDLAGPDGNAMSLISRAASYGIQCGYKRDEISRITSAMRSGSYSESLDTLEREFPGLEFEFDNDPRTTGEAK